jgi:hypothetical protein
MEEILGLLGSVIGSFTQNNQTDATQKQLSALINQNKVPRAFTQGADILAEQANEGLPGYENMRGEIQAELPTTLNQLKDSASAGSLLDVIGNFQAKQNQQLRTLANQNAQAKMGNKEKYAAYLGGTLGNAQQEVQNTNQQLQLAKIATMQQGNASQQKNLMQGLGDIGKFGDSDNSGWLAGLFGGGTTTPNDPVFGTSGTVDKNKISTLLDSSSGEDPLLQGMLGIGNNYTW